MGLKLSGDISTSGIVTSKQCKIGESSTTAKTRIRNKKNSKKEEHALPWEQAFESVTEPLAGFCFKLLSTVETF